MDEQALLERAREIFVKEPRLIQLSRVERAVFVGDTHGDLEATQLVIGRYLQPETALVFLGDYVDRGPYSRENLEFLLQLKLERPERVYLLQGNHEAWLEYPFYPADFWEGLSPERQRLYGEVLAQLPWAAALANGVLALHGALPAVKGLAALGDIELGSWEWRKITWGDWQDSPGYFLGDYGGRPQLGRDYFDEQMARFGMRVLIRSHQPHAPQLLFDDRCLTIFTSCAYGPRERTVAIVPLDREMGTARDLILEGV